MPLDAQQGWRRDNLLTAHEILSALSREFTLTPADPGQRGSAPSEDFLVNGGPGRVGVIGSVTRPFCGACDRVRLTADGQIRNCLFGHEESDVRGPLRDGASDDELASIWVRAVGRKLPGHGINDPGSCSPPDQCQRSAVSRLVADGETRPPQLPTDIGVDIDRFESVSRLLRSQQLGAPSAAGVDAPADVSAGASPALDGFAWPS